MILKKLLVGISWANFLGILEVMHWRISVGIPNELSGGIPAVIIVIHFGAICEEFPGEMYTHWVIPEKNIGRIYSTIFLESWLTPSPLFKQPNQSHGRFLGVLQVGTWKQFMDKFLVDFLNDS